jgi:hypothetical protein
MTAGTRLISAVAALLLIAFLLLFALPKTCARIVQVSKAHREQAQNEPSGLHIRSSATSAAKPLTYPAGLDADRLRYLIETDSRFAAPLTVTLAQSSSDEPAAAAALRKLGYAQTAADGTLSLTPEGVLHVDGLVDQGSAWTFPIARRRLKNVTAIDADADGAHCTFTWQWEPNAVGSAMLSVAPVPHESTAELRNNGGTWTLTNIAQLDDELR